MRVQLNNLIDNCKSEYWLRQEITS